MQIENAQNYRENVIDLLANENLPTSDLPETLENFIVAKSNDEVIGVAGVEIYGEYGLLRSVAVQSSFRGKGIANVLLENIESIAVSKSLKEIYLLTETAQEYFSKKGYQKITRLDVPVDVQTSTEFSHVCPQSAIVMKKGLLIT